MDGSRSKIGEMGKSTPNKSVRKKGKESSNSLETFERGVIRACQGMEWPEWIVVVLLLVVGPVARQHVLGTCFQQGT
jgi:hypothetical protein